MTYNKCSLFMTIVDDFTRCKWIHMMKYKSKIVSILQNLVSFVHNQFKSSIQCIRTDNAKEFCEGKLKRFFCSKGYSSSK